MTPRPYGEKSSLPIDSSDDGVSGIPTHVLPQTPSPGTLSAATTPSPTPEEVPIETFVETVVTQDSNRVSSLIASTPCYPTPGDIMPYDHSLPDFIRQITNQTNLANLQKLSLRVISTLISLHRMSTYLPNLRELDLEGSVLNSLRDIGCNLKNLQILKVGRCQLDSLDGTFGISSLRELYAQKNFINDVSPCSNLPHIRHIDVSGNRIRNISYAGFLSVCSKLKSIVFTGNPATEASDYRKHVRRILPQIETLDDIPFSNEDEANEVTEQENCFESNEIALANFSNNSYLESKDMKILENQFLPNNSDFESRETSLGVQPPSDFQDQNLQKNSEVEEIFLGEEESPDIVNMNKKQKCNNIQKLDKDMVNRSKKTNLLKSENFSEEFSSSEILNHPPSEGDDAVKNEDPRNFLFKEDELAVGFSTIGANSGGVGGTMKKRFFCAVPNSKNKEEEENWGLHKLTTGLPVCGNLTAALRNRKKIQSGCSETYKSVPQGSSEPGREEFFEFCGNFDGDFVTAADNNDNVLFAYSKHTESFHYHSLKRHGDKKREEETE